MTHLVFAHLGAGYLTYRHFGARQGYPERVINVNKERVEG